MPQSLKLLVSLKTAVPAYGPIAAAFYAINDPFKFEFNQLEKDVTLVNNSESIHGTSHVLRALASLFPYRFQSQNLTLISEADFWLDFARDNLHLSDFKKVSHSLDLLENHLTLRSFIVGYNLTIADFAIWGALKSNAIFNKQMKTGSLSCIHLSRWYKHMNSLECVAEGLKALTKAKDSAKDRSDQGSLDIPLPGASEGTVVTRFPPEPSGYLHIGHAKAAMLNDYFAKHYKGKLILRFDDTNPSKEKMEFESSIKEDLVMLGIKHDVVTHTSSYFDQLYQYALQLIKLGLAYVDDTDVDTMRSQRFDGTESKNRNLPIEENLRLFEDMKNGTAKGLESCLRAKIDMQDKNKCMRDPVIYRCNLTPHHLEGTRWKMYPTYDFACPIVDSIEGVTHALRTIEYRDRNPQYAWFLKTLSLRYVHVWDFSRLNFIYTLLSKRKLTWFVEKGHVTGWDDPRFATVRGILRRGMTVEALRAYILSQGASQREISLEWDKIWTMNKRVIDPVSPRHTALLKSDLVSVKIVDESVDYSVKILPKHKKNPEVGNKNTTFGPHILFEQQDAAALELDEEVTLMDWGNAFVKGIKKEGNKVISLDLSLNLDGDFKKTKKKLTWLCPGNSVDTSLTSLILLDYDYLITKKKLEEDDSFEDCVNTVTEFKIEAFGDANLRLLKKGDVIQLERKGYYICDKIFSADSPFVHLIFIPDGKADSIALKARSTDTEKITAPKMEKEKSAKVAKPASAPKKLSMYEVGSIYQNFDQELAVGKSSAMYAIDSVYPKATGKVKKATDSLQKQVKATNATAPPSAATFGEASLISKLDLCVGKVLSVEKHPDADSLYIEKIDVGEAEPRQVVSGLVKFMAPDEIMGMTLVVLKNLKPVSMRGVKSFAMVMCASNSDHSKVEFLIPPEGSSPGEKVYFPGHIGEPEAQLNPKKKIFETIQPDFSTRDDLVATWQGVPFTTDKGEVKAASLREANIK